MSENIRIKTTPGGGNKNINVKINQKFDFIEILSLKISQEEAYRRFCSDYGTVVGRVIVNNGFGVPNARVSIFIPIDEEDTLDPDIFGLYPFEVVTDKDGDGIPYNLMPKSVRGKDECYTSVGTFPSKREIQDNPEISDIYTKYYKFSTTTNNSGDFMIFGVPVGTHFVHVDADISDIGLLSQRPYDLISQGADSKKFYSASKFKNRRDNPNLTQLKTVSPVSVTVVPFWGDIDECEVGISRVDVDLKTTIIPSAIFMGSIVTDSDKNSVNKNCRPRNKMGNSAELVAGEGTVEMIRYTNDGGIERFDVEGGQLIDDKGTWAYQVPMNLDYKVTAEDGTLIPSDDATRGIPTRSRVRFKIGMNSTGGEGRLRSRAKYLVPHNPDNWEDSDYTFGPNTRDKHFADFYWNKIYTIKNHISRVQNKDNINKRNFIGIKDVDEGNNNPFPFNRLHSGFHPLFFIICIILTIVVQIICLLNSLIFPIINFIMKILNTILLVICEIIYTIGRFLSKAASLISKIPGVTWRVNKEDFCIGCFNGGCSCRDIIPYIPFITLPCPIDPEDKKYAPCGKDNGFSKTTFRATQEQLSQASDEVDVRCGEVDIDYDTFWYDDGTRESQLPFGNDAGFIKCILFAIADAINIFSFDFYSDWLNGTLYAFLFKYKFKKNGKEKYCNVDESKKNKKLIDTCTGSDINSNETTTLREGYLKKFEGELFYPAYARTKSYKLFATGITSLGSVFDCDWQGIPKLYPFLLDTSYKRPPLIQDVDETNTLVLSGFDNEDDGGGPDALIASINCTGLKRTNCNSIKRICEIGMGLDERRLDEGLGLPDNKILNNDIENPFIRGALIYANNPSIVVGTTIPLVYIDENDFDYSGRYYKEYRDVTINKIKQYENSFYFYFGLNEGNTALTKLITNFFPSCVPEKEVDFFIVANNITEDDAGVQPTGAIDIEVIGGVGPYSFEWIGPIVDGVQYPLTNNIEDISNLYSGTYIVTVTDSVGNVTEGTFIVPGPPSVICDIQNTPVSQNGLSDGQIIVNVTSGTNPYSIILNNYEVSTGTILSVVDSISITTNSHVFTNLSAGEYFITVSDNSVPQTECSEFVEINEPQSLSLTLEERVITCNSAKDGMVIAVVIGGVPPYTYDWVGASSPGNVISNLDVDSVTVTDSVGQVVNDTVNLTQPPTLGFNTNVDKNITCLMTADVIDNDDNITELGEGSENGQITINGLTGGVPPYMITLQGGFSDISETITGTSVTFTDLPYGDSESGTLYLAVVEDSVGCIKTEELGVRRPIKKLGGTIENSTIEVGGDNVPVYEAIPVGGFGNTPISSGNDSPIGSFTYQWYSTTNPTIPTVVSDLTIIGGQTNAITANIGGLRVCGIRDNNGTGGFCDYYTNPF